MEILMPLGVLGMFAAFVALVGVLSSLRVLMEYERGVVFRMGKLMRAKGPGIVILLPFGVDRMKKMDLRIVALDVSPQDTITKDNVTLKVNAVLYFRVMDPAKAVVEIEDYYFATSQLAQTTMRAVVGQSELDELLADRERINEVIREIIDKGTEPWGIEVTGVEIKDIDLPPEMKRAMARQAEAERERRAKVIAAQGEYEASEKLAMAADVIRQHPAALQLRYLQTVAEIATENNSTTLFPIPLELFGGLVEKYTGVRGGGFGSYDASPTAPAAPPALPSGDAQDAASAASRALGLGGREPAAQPEKPADRSEPAR
jgi:regulator of protease activity HflC (stomatin/prohibitin superfamily)